MNAWLESLLTIVISTALCAATLLFLNLALGAPVGWLWVALVGTLAGFAYSLQAGILRIYDLAAATGWLTLLLDVTWNLPNTLAGFVVGNALFPWFGNLSVEQSRHKTWVVYMPPASTKTGFGKDVLQIWGTVNIGGAGQHERMHLWQARIFGPLYLPLFAANYVVNFLVQLVWTITLGGILWLAKVREKPYFRPGDRSVVSGFFGWIYYATLFEFWAYKSGNP